MKGLKLACIAMIVISGCDTLFFEKEDDQSGNLDIYDAFYSEIDEYFSFFEYIPNDFDSAYQVNRIKLEEKPTQRELINRLQELINALEDGHTDVFIGRESLSYTGWYDQYPRNQLHSLEDYFSTYNVKNKALEYGTLKAGPGYIRIKTFSGEVPRTDYEAIDEILSALSSSTAIIIDVRSNGGGNSLNADLIASRFNDTERVAFRWRRRNGSNRDDFTEWRDTYTQVHSGYRYDKPIAILTNRRSFSSTEWFVSLMKTMPQTTIIGDTTGGGSGNPIPRVLPNGWSLRVSNTQKMLPDGYDYQYQGIRPDIPVWITLKDAEQEIDTILETAIHYLTK